MEGVRWVYIISIVTIVMNYEVLKKCFFLYCEREWINMWNREREGFGLIEITTGDLK